MEYEPLMEEIEKIVNENKGRDEKLRQICSLLYQHIPYYNWVGFYMANEEKKELTLGPFIGEPTEHVRIPFGKGICGQAAVAKTTFVVEDVSKESNYLSCSPEVESEIVVPIMKNGRMVAQLDIDSHKINAFSNRDRKFLEKICERIATLFD